MSGKRTERGAVVGEKKNRRFPPAQVAAGARDEPQAEAHADSPFSVVKVWVFDAPLADAHGPLTIARGSHRKDAGRLSWEHARARDAQSAREPSFRLRSPTGESSAAAAAFVASLSFTPITAVANRTLVVADTSAVHYRATGEAGYVRVSSRLQGDNGGGLKRRNPFRFPDEVSADDDPSF